MARGGAPADRKERGRDRQAGVVSAVTSQIRPCRKFAGLDLTPDVPGDSSMRRSRRNGSALLACRLPEGSSTIDLIDNRLQLSLAHC